MLIPFFYTYHHPDLPRPEVEWGVGGGVCFFYSSHPILVSTPHHVIASIPSVLVFSLTLSPFSAALLYSYITRRSPGWLPPMRSRGSLLRLLHTCPSQRRFACNTAGSRNSRHLKICGLLPHRRILRCRPEAATPNSRPGCNLQTLLRPDAYFTVPPTCTHVDAHVHTRIRRNRHPASDFISCLRATVV